MISIVVPMYNEARMVRELHRRIVMAMAKTTHAYEIIFVNDGSTDETEKETEGLCPVKVISLQRNYGETPALDVGIQEAKGDILVLLDADLQHDPADIPRLLSELSEDVDVIIGWRQVRHDHWTRVAFSYFANSVSRAVLGVDVHDFGSGLKIYRSKFIKDFRLWGDAQVFLPAVAKEKGARIKEIPIQHYVRQAGMSKIRIANMIKGGFDLLSIAFFVKYFQKPLRFFGGWGVAFVGFSLLVFVSSVVLRFMHVANLSETPLPVIGTMFMILGILLFMMGLLAEVLLRVYYVMIHRSPYMVRHIRENK